MSKQPPKKTSPPKLTPAQKAANHKANYNWLDVVRPRQVPGCAAELLQLEQQAWWQEFRESERRTRQRGQS